LFKLNSIRNFLDYCPRIVDHEAAIFYLPVLRTYHFIIIMHLTSLTPEVKNYQSEDRTTSGDEITWRGGLWDFQFRIRKEENRKGKKKPFVWSFCNLGSFFTGWPAVAWCFEDVPIGPRLTYYNRKDREWGGGVETKN
jgi:hypothetical protein